MRIRDEAHRFGITLHRRLRGKAQLQSQLDAIEGIGPKRKQQLLRALGSVKRIAGAGIEELTAVPGIGPDLAAHIYRQLHGGEHDAG